MKRVIPNITKTSMTIESAFIEFIKHKESEGMVKETLRSYRAQIKPFMEFCKTKKKKNTSDINSALIDDFKLTLVGNEEIAQDTKNSYLRALKCFISYLTYIEEIPTIRVKLFNTPSKATVSVYSDEEIKKLINCKFGKSKDFSELRNYAMMLTFLLTGARRNTILKMHVSDVDFTNDILTLRHIKRDKTFQIREVPLNPDLRAALSKYLRVTKVGEHSELLFPNVGAEQLHPDTVNKQMEKLFTVAGVEFRGCHEFRRTFATKTYRQLGDLEAVRKLMMISDVRVLKRYINEDMDMLKESVKKLAFVTQLQATRPLCGNIKKGA